MPRSCTYFPGGYDPDAPALNQAEVWDGDAGTYTAFDPAGDIVVERPLTEDETTQLYRSVTTQPDIVQLADQVSDLTDAVNLLIITQLGG